MVHAEDRPAAVDRLRRALDETAIGGVQTDAGFLRWLVDDTAFAVGDYDTSLIGERWRGGPEPRDEDLELVARAALDARMQEARTAPRPPDGLGPGSEWGRRARQEALRR
jgi:acetyl/propionyl-CoA carboxylase alpha subunit